MSISSISSRPARASFASNTGWWSELGLQSSMSIGKTSDDHELRAQVLTYLQGCAPTGFTRSSSAGADHRDGVGYGSGEPLTIAQVSARISEITREHEENARAAALTAAQTRVRQGWERLEAAYAASDASDVVDAGRWCGFTRADATAWSWNLFQYEPHGFVHPGSEVRVRAITALKAGELPEVFGYPERSRTLADNGLNPRSYRSAQEKLGKPTFNHGDLSLR